MFGVKKHAQSVDCFDPDCCRELINWIATKGKKTNGTSNRRAIGTAIVTPNENVLQSSVKWLKTRRWKLKYCWITIQSALLENRQLEKQWTGTEKVQAPMSE